MLFSIGFRGDPLFRADVMLDIFTLVILAWFNCFLSGVVDNVEFEVVTSDCRRVHLDRNTSVSCVRFPIGAHCFQGAMFTECLTSRLG